MNVTALFLAAVWLGGVCYSLSKTSAVTNNMIWLSIIRIIILAGSIFYIAIPAAMFDIGKQDMETAVQYSIYLGIAALVIFILYNEYKGRGQNASKNNGDQNDFNRMFSEIYAKDNRRKLIKITIGIVVTLWIVYVGFLINHSDELEAGVRKKFTEKFTVASRNIMLSQRGYTSRFTIEQIDQLSKHVAQCTAGIWMSEASRWDLVLGAATFGTINPLKAMEPSEEDVAQCTREGVLKLR